MLKSPCIWGEGGPILAWNKERQTRWRQRQRRAGQWNTYPLWGWRKNSETSTVHHKSLTLFTELYRQIVQVITWLHAVSRAALQDCDTFGNESFFNWETFSAFLILSQRIHIFNTRFVQLSFTMTDEYPVCMLQWRWAGLSKGGLAGWVYMCLCMCSVLGSHIRSQHKLMEITI